MNCMYVKGKKNPNKYLWARFGDREKPGVECSSKGHKHYSAMYALMPDGRSIEIFGRSNLFRKEIISAIFPSTFLFDPIPKSASMITEFELN